MAERNTMTILEQLREKKKEYDGWYEGHLTDEQMGLLDLLSAYDLALENALLKLKNRGIEIADLKNRIKELKLITIKAYKAIECEQYELAKNLVCSREAKEY